MRPKKSLLLYCLDDLRGSRVSFVLRTHGYAVTQVDRLALLGHALDFNLPFSGALVLDSGEASHGEDAVAVIQRHVTRPPVMLQLARLSTRLTLAERVLDPGSDMQELVQAVRLMCVRRRGPAPSTLPIGAQRAQAAAGKAAVA